MSDVPKTVEPTIYDKWILVYLRKKYKSTKDVPNQVSLATINSGRNHARIRISIALTLVTIGGILILSNKHHSTMSGHIDAAMKKLEGKSAE